MSDQKDQKVLGNTETKTRAQRFTKVTFTLNNWSEEELKNFKSIMTRENHKFIVGKEVGESGTPHLQGYVEFLKKRPTLKVCKDMIGERAHIEKALGNKKQNIAYCSKDGDYEHNFPPTPKERMLAKYSDVVWKEWQQNIIDIIKGEICPRAIHWVYDEEGNSGKSYLVKYLALKYDVIIGSGKKDNVFNQVRTYMEANAEEMTKIVLVDIPRSSEDYINYGAIEKVKDGCFYSGKYEGGICTYEIPHVIVFANCRAKRGKWSGDRLREVIL